MQKKINEVAKEACLSFISESDTYTVENFLKEYGAWRNVDTTRFDDVKLSCPFHGSGGDSNPSFHVEPSTGRWHCFSCNRGGKYMQLVTEYNKEILRTNFGFYHLLNNILLADKKMSLMTGYATIFSQEEEKFVGNYKRSKFVPKKNRTVNTYIELANEMDKKNLTSYDQIALAILYVQDGYKPEEILEYLQGANSQVAATEESLGEFNIQDILDTLG
jgi:hypothetical protein